MNDKQSKLMRCSQCNGAKKIAPLGGIEKSCKACKGTGFNEVVIKRACDVIINAGVKVDKRSKAYRDSLKGE